MNHAQRVLMRADEMSVIVDCFSQEYDNSERFSNKSGGDLERSPATGNSPAVF